MGMHCWMMMMGALVTEDIEKVELLKAFFSSIFNAKTNPCESQVLETRVRVWGKENFPFIKEDLVKGCLGKLDAHKSIDLNGMHSPVLRELAEVIAMPLSYDL